MTAIVSAISCSRTKALHSLIVEHCESTVVLSIHEKTCPRPPKTIGIGFPVTSSVSDVVPMLVDMRHDFLATWTQINLVHDQSVTKDVIIDLIDGLEGIRASHILPTSVTTYSVSGVRKSGGSSMISDHSKCITPTGRSQIHFSGAHLARHIQSDSSMKFFILMGRSRTIENVVEEVSSHG